MYTANKRCIVVRIDTLCGGRQWRGFNSRLAGGKGGDTSRCVGNSYKDKVYFKLFSLFESRCLCMYIRTWGHTVNKSSGASSIRLCQTGWSTTWNKFCAQEYTDVSDILHDQSPIIECWLTTTQTVEFVRQNTCRKWCSSISLIQFIARNVTA